MRKDKAEAMRLRKAGKSYREIKAKLKVPMGTLSAWFSGQGYSRAVRRKFVLQNQRVGAVRFQELNRVRGEGLARAYADARTEAREEFESLKYHPLFIAGLMLYAGQGLKSASSPVKLSGTDSEQLRLFVFFLSEVCRIPIVKIRAQVLVYPDLEPLVTQAYWVKQLGLTPGNFTGVARLRPRKGLRRPTWGLCSVSVSSLYLKQKVLEWLTLLPQELMNREYYAKMTGAEEAT